MSPIKFEENIKKELEQRTIKVSEGSWNKLSNRLDAEEKPKKKPYWWIGIAASAVIALWFTVDLVTTPDLIIPTVVIEPEIKTGIPIEDKVIAPEKSENLVVQEKIKSNKTEIIEENIKFTKIDETENHPRVAKVISIPLKVVQISTLEEQKIDDIVAFVLESNQQNELVSDAEIEDLMLQAQNEIQLQKLFNDTTTNLNANAVNADALLYEVESEIDKSFRDKVFKELKIHFKSIKNAVAQRNN